ncbi:helix-turn-helix transcriptional regulator [uncultured Lamprocystis sp.]|jgi:transcriptional regulator with XRE-family HTH domain|uniref:helix-turn-helix domain-containing protein n=1 Tax=uncultured Lamprocystis sp. TaxID=543132 RepID=UPI00341B233A
MDRWSLLDFAARLREERNRLGLTQAEVCEAGGVQPRAQVHYEKGERTPDAEYLAGLRRIGMDVLYVLCGQRGSDQPPGMDPAAEVLNLWRGLPREQQTAVRVILSGLSRV